MKTVNHQILVELTVQMIKLMTYCSCKQSLSLDRKLLHILIVCLTYNMHRSCHRSKLPRQAETSLLACLLTVSLDYLGIYKAQRIVITDIYNNYSLEYSNLWSSKSYTIVSNISSMRVSVLSSIFVTGLQVFLSMSSPSSLIFLIAIFIFSFS